MPKDQLDVTDAAQAGCPLKTRYDNYIGGGFKAPNAGRYFENLSPITGGPIGEIARSDASDIEGTRSNLMERVLDPGHWPWATLRMTSISHRDDHYSAMIRIAVWRPLTTSARRDGNSGAWPGASRVCDQISGCNSCM